MRIRDWLADVCSSYLFGDNAVLCWRIRRRAYAHQRVGTKHQQQLIVVAKAEASVTEHQHTAAYFDGIGNEHDATLGVGVGEGPHEGGQHNIGQGKPPRSEEHTSELQSLMRS